MPIPNFVDGEVLSAAQLNALVIAADKINSRNISVLWPFQQVQVDGGENQYQNSGVDHTWTWVFKYSKTNKYLKCRFSWNDVQPDSSVQIIVNHIQAYQIHPPAALQTATIDLGDPKYGLVEGAMFEVEFYAYRSGAGHCRVELLYLTNNSSYEPTIM